MKRTTDLGWSQLPPPEALDRARADYRRQLAEDEAPLAGFDTAALLFGDVLAAAVYLSTMPTALRVEGAAA